MNLSIFEGKWEEIKGKVKKTWANLTDDDLLKIEGKQQEIYGVLEQRYGYTKDEAKNAVEKFKGTFNEK